MGGKHFLLMALSLNNNCFKISVCWYACLSCFKRKKNVFNFGHKVLILYIVVVVKVKGKSKLKPENIFIIKTQPVYQVEQVPIMLNVR